MASAQLSGQGTVVYPESDGRRMADNTLQWEWIATIKYGLEILFRDDPAVFVAGDLLWYPVEGEPKTCAAPDAMVAFGRPKGRRGSYKQWLEEGIAPQVVFEVLSPGNRFGEMNRKLEFYERHGVEEYYIYDPEPGQALLEGWRRVDGVLRPIATMQGWTSPWLGVRFGLNGDDLVLTRPDGQVFAGAVEISREKDEISLERNQIAQELDQIARERDVVRARNEELARALEADRLRAERLAAKLRELGIEPD